MQRNVIEIPAIPTVDLDDIDAEETELDLNHSRISSLEGLALERFPKLSLLVLRQNSLTSLVTESGNAPLANRDALEDLDVYDNQLSSFAGLENLENLKALDFSYNVVKHLEQLDDPKYAWPKLEQLFLSQNKIREIAGVADRTSLKYLEFGGNRIREIRNLPMSQNLTQLFLGKNKIEKLQGLDALPNLKVLSVQSNRIRKLEGLEKLTNLEELYVSHNGIEKLEGLRTLTKLNTLDIGNNFISEVPLDELLPLQELTEFWASGNKIDKVPQMNADRFPSLRTVYLEFNPVQAELGSSYERVLLIEMPQLTQIDALPVRRR